MNQKNPPALFLGQTPAQIQPSQGLQAQFTPEFAQQLAELTLPELCFAVKLWSRRVLTLESIIARTEASTGEDQAERPETSYYYAEKANSHADYAEEANNCEDQANTSIDRAGICTDQANTSKKQAGAHETRIEASEAQIGACNAYITACPGQAGIYVNYADACTSYIGVCANSADCCDDYAGPCDNYAEKTRALPGQSLAQSLVQSLDAPPARAARTELGRLQDAFDATIKRAISQVSALQDPAPQFAQLIELSTTVHASRLPQHAYANMLIPLYLRYSHGASRVRFSGARSERQIADILLYIGKLAPADHLALSNAGAALFVAESAPFYVVAAALICAAEALFRGPECAFSECPVITARAEELKMFDSLEFTAGGAELKNAAKRLILHIYTQLLQNPNVYVYLHCPSVRSSYHSTSERLDVFHQTSWAVISALLRFIAGETDAYAACVFPLCHKDALLNLYMALLAHFSQQSRDIERWHGFMASNFGDPIIPMHRRAGCVPFIYAAIFQALALAGDQDAMKSTVQQLWSSPALAARWALLPYYREKLFCGSKRMVHNRAYFDCLIYCIAEVTEQYTARNVYFSLFAAASQQFFSKQQLKLSKLDAGQQEQLFAWCESKIQCQKLLALLLLSFLQSEPNDYARDRLLKVSAESNSTLLQLARSVAVFMTIPEVLESTCSYFWILVMRQLTRGSCKYKSNRGHALFNEMPIVVAVETRELVLRWIEPFRSESAFYTKFWRDFKDELANSR